MWVGPSVQLAPLDETSVCLAADASRVEALQRLGLGLQGPRVL